MESTKKIAVKLVLIWLWTVVGCLGRRQTWQTKSIRSEISAVRRHVSSTRSLRQSSLDVVVFATSGRRSDYQKLDRVNVSLHLILDINNID